MTSGCCITIPVHEIEAWILADLDQAVVEVEGFDYEMASERDT